METYQILYTISIMLHLWALAVGVETLREGTEKVFSKNNISDIFKSDRIRRKAELFYIATVLGVGANISFSIAKIGYVIILGGTTTGLLEPVFVLGHLLAGVTFVILHHKALDEIRGIISGKSH